MNADRPLNPKQLRFVALHQKAVAAGTPNATQSYLDAGYTCSRASAEAAAARLLGDVRVQQLLKPTKQAAEVARTEQVRDIVITRDRIRAEFAKLAFVNPKRFFNADGTAKGIHDLDDDVAAALASFEVDEVWEATEGESAAKVVTRTKKFKLWDKVRALSALGDTEPGVWVKEDATGHTTNVNVAVMSDAELARRIDALEGRTEPASGAQRLLEVAPAAPAGIQLDVAASGEGYSAEAPAGDGRAVRPVGGDDSAAARQDP